MILTFFLSLILVALMGFTALVAVLCLLNFFSKHIGLVVAIGAIVWIYWAVKDKFLPQSAKNIQEPVSTETPNIVILKNNAENGYRPMRTIIFRLLKEVGGTIGLQSPQMYLDIETTEKYCINYGCAFYQFQSKKIDTQKQLSDEELDENVKILQDTFAELW